RDVSIRLDDVDDLYRMIVNISQINSCLFADKIAVFASQETHDISKRPDRTTQENQLTLHSVDVLESLRGRVIHCLVLQGRKPFAHSFQHEKIMVYYGVDQCVREVIRSASSNSASGSLYSRSNRIKNITRQ